MFESIGRRTALAIATATVALGAAAPAHALLNLNLGGTLSTTTSNLTTTTNGLLGGVLGTTTTVVNGVTCPLATSLQQTLAQTPGLGDGLGAIGSGLTSLTCASSLLDYQLVTRYRRPDGSIITRTTPALLGVPTALNVDDDLLTDLRATVSLTSLNSVGLKVDRDLLKSAANLPVSVEAVLGDRSTTLLGRRHLAVGFDATMDQAPGSLTLSTPVDTLTRPGGEVRIDLGQSARRSRIALTAGLFDGTPAARVEPTEARIDYGASPDSASIAATLGQETRATLTTNRPGAGDTTVSGRVVDGTTTDAFEAVLRKQPATTTVALDSRSGTRLTYAASARIASLSAQLRRTTGGTLAQKTTATLTDVPTGITATVLGDKVVASTTGGPIGLTEIATANGEPKVLTGEPAYLLSDDDGAVRSIAARIPGLSAVDADVSSAPRVSARIASTPLLARLRTPGRTIDARVLDLPSAFTLGLDLEAGRLAYDGQGSGIGRVTLDATSATPLIGRATDLRGVVRDVPASLELTFRPDGDRLAVDASNPIGSVELAAANRAVAFSDGGDLPAGGRQGATLVDREGGEFAVGARVLGLRSLSAELGGDVVRLATRTAGGPFDLRVDTDELTGTAEVRDLPAKLEAVLDLPAGKLAVRGDDGQTRIGRLSARLTAATGLFGRARFLSADVTDIPADLVLDLAQEGQGVRVEANEPIGSAELVASSRAPQGDDLPAGGEQGVKLVDAADEFTLGARIRKFRKVAARVDGDVVRAGTETEGGPFGIRYRTDELNALARIQDLPAKLDAVLDLGAGKLTLDGHGEGIERVAFDAASATPLFGRARFVQGRIERLAPLTVVDVAQSGTGVRVEANEPIGLVEVAAAAAQEGLGAALPADGKQGVTFEDTPQAFTAGARVRDLRKVEAVLDGAVRLSTRTASGEFLVRARTADLDADARIADLPDALDGTLDLERGALSFRTSGVIDEVAVKAVGRGAPLLGRATRLEATIRKLAKQADITIDPAAPSAQIDADTPIEQVDLLATDLPDGAGAPAIADGEQGAIYHDRAGEPFVLAARLLDLRKIGFAFAGDAIGIDATLRSTPFSVDARTQDLEARARIDRLPAQTDLSFDLDDARFTYAGKDGDGNPTGVDEVSFHATSQQPVFDRARKLEGRLTDVPSGITVGLSGDRDGARVEVPEGEDLGDLELFVADDPAKAFPLADQGVRYVDTAGAFEIAAKVTGLKKLDVGLAAASGIGLQIDRTAGSRFVADVDVDGLLRAKADIQDLPASAELSVDLDGSSDNPNALVFRGRDADGEPAGIGLLTLDARADTPILGGGSFVRGRIEGLPSDVAIGFSQEEGRATVRAIDPRDPEGEGTPVGLIELAASDTADGFVLPTTDGGEPAQGAILHTKAGEPFRVGVRVRELRELSVLFDGAVQLRAKTAGGPFLADVRTDDFAADARILDLPSELDLGLDLDTGTVRYTGSGRIGRIFVDAQAAQPLFLGATGVEVDLQDVPEAFTLGLAQAAGEAPGDGEEPAPGEQVPATSLSGLRLQADQPIGVVSVRAKSAGRDYPSLPAGQSGAVLDATLTDAEKAEDPTQEQLALALRVHELKLLDVNLTPLTLETEMEAGRVFSVDAKLPQEPAEDGTPRPDLKAVAVVDQLPAKVKIGLGENLEGDPTPMANGSRLMLEASAPVDKLTLSTRGLELLDGADAVEAAIEDLPQQVDVVLPDTGDLARIEARNAAGTLTPIGQLRLAAGAGTAELPADDFDETTGQAGGLNDLLKYGTTPAFDIRTRVTGIKRVALNLDPVKLDAETAGGKKLDIDAEASLVDDAPATKVKALIDSLPSSVSLALGDNPQALSDGSPNGTQLAVVGNQRIGLVTLDVSGLELLPGASVIRAAIHDLPPRTTITIPEEGALAQILGRNAAGTAEDAIGQLRLAAGDAGAVLPAYVDPASAVPGTVTQATSSNDLLRFSTDPASFGIGLRLSGAKFIGVNLDPVALELRQDAARTRPITIDAKIPAGETTSDVKGLINRPGARTKLDVLLSEDPSVPSRIAFDNDVKLTRLELNATNLGSIPLAKLSFDNVAPKLVACLDPGNGCRRTNPNVPGNTTSSPKACTGGNIFNPCSGAPLDKWGNRYNANGNGRPYAAQASLDFNDQGTLGTGTAATDFTTFRAKLQLAPGQPEIAFGDPDTGAGGLTFKSFSLDLGTAPAGQTISSFGQTLPALYMFFDSKSNTGAVQPFVMSGVKYPPLVANFNVGSQSNKATANSRFVWARGDGSIITAPTSTATGSMNCGGAKELSIATGLGNINALNVLGLNFALLPVC